MKEPSNVTETALPFPFTWSTDTVSADEYQPQGIDLTIYCGEGGVTFDRKRSNEIDFAIIQIGVGVTASSLFDEQVKVCQDFGVPFAFFVLPSAYAGPVKDQARWAYRYIADRGLGDRFIMGDYEPAKYGDWNSMISADQAYIHIQELEFVAGRQQLAYSNPNILLYKYYMPAWVNQFKWCMAQYPEPYGYFHEFKYDYEWQFPPTYWDKYPEFKRQIIFWQFTKKLRAKEYFAVDRLPNGGDGLNSGDGYVSLLPMIETLKFMVGDDLGPLPPEPPQDDILYEAKIVNCSQLRIRSGPDYPAHLADHVGWIFAGKRIAVFEELEDNNGNICCRIGGPEMWAWRHYNGAQYMEIIKKQETI